LILLPFIYFRGLSLIRFVRVPRDVIIAGWDAIRRADLSTFFQYVPTPSLASQIIWIFQLNCEIVMLMADCVKTFDAHMSFIFKRLSKFLQEGTDMPPAILVLNKVQRMVQPSLVVYSWNFKFSDRSLRKNRPRAEKANCAAIRASCPKFIFNLQVHSSWNCFPLFIQFLCFKRCFCNIGPVWRKGKAFGRLLGGKSEAWALVIR
jgi:hypothetical protein